MDWGPSPFYVEINPEGSLVLRGELDVNTVDQLEEMIAKVVRPGRPVVFDMAQLSFIDSTGVMCLVRTYRTAEEPVIVCNPSSQVRRVLEILDARVKPGAWVIQVD